VLSLQGNAITISKELWRLGVRDAVTLRQQIWEDRKKKVYTIGVTCPLGSQYALLCDWLRSVKEPPYTEVRIESIPPEQLFPLLKLGYLDGYCAGEPWNSVAVQAGAGACVATSAMLAPLHPEKILMVRKNFASDREEEHERLIAALIEACHFCDQPENQRLVCTMLAQARYVNAPVECVEPGLIGPFGQEGAKVPSLHGLNIFHRNRANEPTSAKAAWLTGRLFAFLRWDVRPVALNGVFRADIFKRAWRLLPKHAGPREKPERNIESRIEAKNGC
jgi:ABC-type nitrate/sulfonate/bicarbonate transport system substrate-binding protein